MFNFLHLKKKSGRINNSGAYSVNVTGEVNGDITINNLTDEKLDKIFDDFILVIKPILGDEFINFQNEIKVLFEKSVESYLLNLKDVLSKVNEVEEVAKCIEENVNSLTKNNEWNLQIISELEKRYKESDNLRTAIEKLSNEYCERVEQSNFEIRRKLNELKEIAGDTNKRVREIEKYIRDITSEQLNGKLETQMLEIDGIKGVVIEEGKKTQGILSNVIERLDDLMEKVQKNDIKSDDYLVAALPQNKDFDLGWWYYCNGKYSESLKCLFKAASENHFRAQYIIGCCYYNGDGVEMNLREAAKWFTMSAKSGYSEALRSLGDCYYHGHGDLQDPDNAFKCYLEAANRHNANAMYCVGDCYEHGVGVEQNILSAVEWYRRSADLGDPYGQFALGCCYYFEKGVPKDCRKAADLFFQAANGGHPDAQENYAECLEKGIGVQVDIEEAIKYYELAAKQGSKDAENAATRLSLVRKK